MALSGEGSPDQAKGAGEGAEGGWGRAEIIGGSIRGAAVGGGDWAGAGITAMGTAMGVVSAWRGRDGGSPVGGGAGRAAVVQPLVSPTDLGLGVLPQATQSGVGGFTVAETGGETDGELAGSTLAGAISGGAIPTLLSLISPVKH